MLLRSVLSDGIGGSLSAEDLGVERLSREDLGRLAADELAELNVVKFMSTLCGLRFIFCKVDAGRGIVFGGRLEVWVGAGLSNCRDGINDRCGSDDGLLEVSFEASPCWPPFSASLSPLWFGDGDLDEEIHDFRAKVTNDPDTVLDLSLEGLEMKFLAGGSTDTVSVDSRAPFPSGDPFTR
jgi:hypothetical protein